MNLELGSPIVEVVIALAFIYFLLSLMVSGGLEVVAWATKRRAGDLKEGIRALLDGESGDGSLAAEVLDHPLVKSDVRPSSKREPSYVSARNFAMALIAKLRKADKVGTEAFDGIKESVAAMGGPAGAQLQALLGSAEADLGTFQGSVETWFDDAMERVSGWYKRWSQKLMIVLAIVVVVALNASSVRIVERLYSQPSVRAAVVATAEKTAAGPAPKAGEEAPPTAAGGEVESAYQELNELKLPLLWSKENVPWASVKAFLLALVGWAITAAAISLGAPFWFDTLKKAANLRTAGKKPDKAPAGG